MNFEVMSGAAAVALAGSAVFTLLARSWYAVTRPRTGDGTFAAWIMPEAAQRFRDELDGIRRKEDLFLAAGLVFATVFAIAYLLLAVSSFPDLRLWQVAAIGAILVVSAAFAGWRLVSAIAARRRLEFVRDAAIATGQGLQRLGGSLNRVFHEVPCGDSVLDSVIAGLHGIYAVHVVARRPGRHNRLRVKGDRLLFAPGRYSIPMTAFTEQSELFARQLKKTLKLPVRVRTVIAVPGWEIEEQSADTCLVVNERNLVMLQGWKDSEDYLMHEDVERLHELLAERCMQAAK